MEYDIVDNKTVRMIGWGAAIIGIILLGIYFAIVTTAFNKQHELLDKVCERTFPEMQYEVIDGKKVLTAQSIGQITLRVEGLKEYCVEQEAK